MGVMNATAIGFRQQIEDDRKAAHAEVDAKYNKVLQALNEAFGNVTKAGGGGKRRGRKPGRKPKSTATATASGTETTETTGSSDGDTAANDSDAPSEEESYHQSEAFHDACTAIRQYLLTQTDGAGRSAILEGTKLAESVYQDAMEFMLTENRIRRVGERRGTKYLLVTEQREAS